MAEVNVIKKKTGSGYTKSIVFLIIVILSTIGLNLYNNYLVSEIEVIKENINSRKVTIKEIEEDKSIQIYSLLELNKNVIQTYKKMNNITKYINHMNVMQGKYNLEFAGFNLSNGIINTNVKAMSDDYGIAYQKIRDFVKKYRNDGKALFDLEFVNSIEGMDIIKLSIKLKIN